MPISWNDLHKELKTIEEDEGLMRLLIEGSAGAQVGGGAEAGGGGAGVPLFALPPAEGGEEVGEGGGVRE